MKCNVTFFPGNKCIDVEAGTTIFQAAVSAGIDIGGSCGGSGSCGKCKVIVDGEHSFDSSVATDDHDQTCCIGCKTKILGDVSVLVTDIVGNQKISSSYISTRISNLSPLAVLKEIKISKPSLENNDADFERIKKSSGEKTLRIVPSALKKLPSALRSNDWNIKIVKHDDEVIDIGDDFENIYGAAIDVGTTTVAAELIDLKTGKVVNVASNYNYQIICGEDVVSRMMYEEENGQKRLTDLILSTINEIIASFDCKIHAVCISGNTTMIHMLLGLETHNIHFEPYVPVTNFPPIWHASDIGINAVPGAPVYIIPGCAGYVGGDITAGILASGLHEHEKPSLLIDVGTNGEIALGCKDWIVTCSTSAGPSFEGGSVSCGMRGMDGAIDSVKIENDEIQYTVIGDIAPKGICGSGIIDLVAQLYKHGKIDKKGHVQNGKIQITDKISLTESDVEDIIRTKAAIFAGCCVLLDTIGITFDDLDSIYIAGGFGTYMNLDSAQTIGLLPQLDKSRYVLLGNASLNGAHLCLVSKSKRECAEEIAHTMTYVDLSSSNSFFDQYSSALFIPHTNEEKFCNVK